MNAGRGDCAALPTPAAGRDNAGPLLRPAIMLTDLHCHMLPGIDDGSKTMEQSLAMARIAVEDGITTTVVTPHHLNGVYRNPAQRIREGIERLNEALQRVGIGLNLLPGSELHLTPELPGELAAGTALTIANQGRAVLVELPVHTVPVGSEQLLEDILAQGLTPVIAHPERNSELRRNPQRLTDWVELGCLAQVTVQSCTGRFGEAVQQAARTMIRSGCIHVAASDAHRDRRRVPQLTPAREPIARWTSDEVARLLIDVYPTDLAAGRQPDLDLLQQALPPIRTSWWRRIVGG
jgi:protein-tyrosine phosphatase